MKLDGIIVGASVNDADTIDAIVSYTPTGSLLAGIHNITVY